MSSGTWVGLGVLAWVACGVVAALVLGRRGHDLRSLVGIAAVFGPLFVPLAVDFARRRDLEARRVVLDRTPSGRHRAIVAVLGSPEAAADALPVLERFGPIEAVTLVAVIDYESADRRDWDEVKAAAAERLHAASTFLSDFTVGRELAPGTPEVALLGLAQGDYRVVVLTGADDDVGAEQVSAVAKVPVVVAPPAAWA